MPQTSLTRYASLTRVAVLVARGDDEFSALKDKCNELTKERDELRERIASLEADAARLAPNAEEVVMPTPAMPSPENAKVLRVAFGSGLRRPIRTETDRTAAASALFDRADAIDLDPERTHEALHLYAEAVKFAPTWAAAWTNLGNCHYRFGDIDRARACYERAIHVAPTEPEGYYNLGYIGIVSCRVAEAIEAFTMALRLDPRFADAEFNLAQAYEDLENKAEACNAYRRYLALESASEWAAIARQRLRDLEPIRRAPIGVARTRRVAKHKRAT